MLPDDLDFYCMFLKQRWNQSELKKRDARLPVFYGDHYGTVIQRWIRTINHPNSVLNGLLLVKIIHDTNVKLA